MYHIIIGLVATLLGIWGVIVWWFEFGAVMRGLIPVLLLAFGTIGIIAGLQAKKDAERKRDGLAGDDFSD
ncbi:MAG: hypothetical protein ACUZ8E_06035 [Candidatus Anammoxibacter sp.]